MDRPVSRPSLLSPFRREEVRAATLAACDATAFAAAICSAVLLAKVFGQALPSLPAILALLSTGAAVFVSYFDSRRYTRQAAPIGHAGHLVRTAAVALTIDALLTLTLFRSAENTLLLLTWFIFPVLAAALRRLVAAVWGPAGIGSLRAVLVGSLDATSVAEGMLQDRPRLGFKLAGAVSHDWPEGRAEWRSLLASNGADLVLVSVQGRHGEQALLRSIEAAGIPAATFIALPDTTEQAGRHRAAISGPGAWAKAVLDFAAALAFVILFLPLMLLLCAIVKLDGGPVLFRHERVGRDGQTFDCLKFRTMAVNADKMLQDLLERDPAALREWANTRKIKNDPRVTRIGRFLRATSLDELPQLLNVLRGEMSLVGPRPVVTAELPRYGDDVGYYLASTPGLTGKWQVSGRSDTSYEQRVLLDVAYAREWSFWTDLAILLQTLPAVMFKRGAF